MFPIDGKEVRTRSVLFPWLFLHEIRKVRRLNSGKAGGFATAELP